MCLCCVERIKFGSVSYVLFGEGTDLFSEKCLVIFFCCRSFYLSSDMTKIKQVVRVEVGGPGPYPRANFTHPRSKFTHPGAKFTHPRAKYPPHQSAVGDGESEESSSQLESSSSMSFTVVEDLSGRSVLVPEKDVGDMFPDMTSVDDDLTRGDLDVVSGDYEVASGDYEVASGEHEVTSGVLEVAKSSTKELDSADEKGI